LRTSERVPWSSLLLRRQEKERKKAAAARINGIAYDWPAIAERRTHEINDGRII
jgi:hypothetical protein